MRLTKALLLALLLTAAHVNAHAAPNTVAADICKPYAPTRAKLHRLYKEYTALADTPENAEPMFLLYQRVEQAAKEAQALYPEKDWAGPMYRVISDCLWEPEFSALGFLVGHYSDRLDFTEKLLADAHRLNPHSQYRRYTLYSEVLGDDIGAELGAMPNVPAAKAYLNEFPDGPYAKDVYEDLAGFYHDLYKELRFHDLQPVPSDHCYAGYIANHPEEAKAEHARKRGIFYMEKVIAALPRKSPYRPMWADELKSLRNGVEDNVDNWCGD